MSTEEPKYKVVTSYWSPWLEAMALDQKVDSGYCFTKEEAEERRKRDKKDEFVDYSVVKKEPNWRRKVRLMLAKINIYI